MKALRPVLFSLFALSAPAFADAHEDAAKLVDITLTSGAVAAGKAAFGPMFDQFRQQGLPEDAIKEIGVAADDFLNTTFSDPELRAEFVKLIEESYTPDEVSAVLAFYETPAGKKNLSLTAVMSQKGAAIGQKYAGKHQQEFQTKIADIMQRYQKPAAAPAPAPAPAPDPAPAPKKSKK